MNREFYIRPLNISYKSCETRIEKDNRPCTIVANSLGNQKLEEFSSQKDASTRGVGLIMANLCQEQQKQREQDKLNRQIPFDPQKHLYPADLFVLVGFDDRGQPIKERNPRWQDKDGFYNGRST